MNIKYMKYVLFLILALPHLPVFSQGVKVINSAGLKDLSEGKKFVFIEPASDSSFFQYVATLQGTDRIRKSNIESLYYELKSKANKLGANGFKLKSFTIDQVADEVILVLDVFFAWDYSLELNKANHEKNVVFIFGKEKDDGKSMTFHINKEEKVLQPGTYYKITLREGEEIKISKGGITGASIWLNYQKDKPPAFYTLTGFGLNDVAVQPANGIGFNTGRINRITNTSLGLLLTQLLKQAN